MPSYKLTYFNGRGRAEWIRLIFAQAGVLYEDVRVDGAQWKDLRPKTPFSALPVLEVDGTSISESKAIAFYVAAEHGLHGDTNLEKARAQMISDVIRNLQDETYKLFFEKDETKKSELSKKMFEETLPSISANLEAQLKQNKSGWFVGNKVTYADLCAFDVFGGLVQSNPAALSAEKTPLLAALLDKVKNLPNISQWLAKRPETSF
jgi:glutathione S-transferase